LNQSIFEDCHKHYLANFTLGETWKTLSIKWGYESGEELRLACKTERRKRGIPNKGADPIAVSVDIRMPRVAVCDIETLPGVAYFWRLYDDFIGIKQIISETCMLSWA